MKILKYSNFINEGKEYQPPFDPYVDRNESLVDRENYDKLIHLLYTVGSYKRMKKLFLEQNENSPADYVNHMLNWFKLAYDNEFDQTYGYFLIINGLIEPNDEKYLEKLKELKDKLYKIVYRVTKMKPEEFDSMNKKFHYFSEKMKENKEKSRIISVEDPYGEEEWDDDNPHDKIKKAWEN